MNRKIRALLAVLLCAVLVMSISAAIPGASAVEYNIGDVDMNGSVDAVDARIVLRAAAKLDTLTAFESLLADVDQSGAVDATDARLVLRFAAKLDPMPDVKYIDPADVTTTEPATEAPTTEPTTVPTTAEPTTAAPTTAAPTTVAPTTEAPTTEAPTTEAPTTAAPTTVVPTTEAPTTEAPTTEPTTVHVSDGSGVPSSRARTEAPKSYYIKVNMTDSKGTSVPMEIATYEVKGLLGDSTRRSTFVHTKGNLGNGGADMDIGIISCDTASASKNGVYVINYEKEKYLYITKAILTFAGIKSEDLTKDLDAGGIDIPKITNISELDPVYNEDGTVTVRLNNDDGSYSVYDFADKNTNVASRVISYNADDSVFSTLIVDAYSEDDSVIKSFFDPPEDFKKLEVFSFSDLEATNEALEFMQEMGIA
ncbi:MAG: dockerin type I repeat-containing protein [Clostridiales bacterium]|nr:dockerin type I repeat-containing protein [Clostridiales bacterium]